ncbi:MAG: hypothetical protein RLZZ393_839 [Pseudomonadota bacterium]
MNIPMRMRFLASLLSFASLLLLQQAPAVASDASLADIGRRIYREGMLADGRPLEGVGQAGVTFSGAAAACVTCHRRSGYGSSEGPIEVRSITGPALFGERPAPPPPGTLGINARVVGQNLHGARPASTAAAVASLENSERLRQARAVQLSGGRVRPPYDDALLARALSEGVDVTGRRMNATMPRFRLDAASQAALTAYLRGLSSEAPTGVTSEAVHFAIVVQPGVDPSRRDTFIQVLRTYLEDRNTWQIPEKRREQTGQVTLGRTSRRWELDVWSLEGAPGTWGPQLEAFQRAKPAFALAGGLGDAGWQPIHDFSEREGIPCIFPLTPLPATGGPSFYTVYLTRGVLLEADVLAQFLNRQDRHRPVVQVRRQGDAEAAAASDALRAADPGAGVVDEQVPATPDVAYWERLRDQHPGADFVLWLRPADLVASSTLLQSNAAANAVYLSSALDARLARGPGRDAAGRLRLVHPQELPAQRDARLGLVRTWLRNHRIPPGDEELQFEAYLVATVVGMLNYHAVDAISRELLLETMEHRLGTGLEVTRYPHISLGPGQRFASKGAYIVPWDAVSSLAGPPLSEWITP